MNVFQGDNNYTTLKINYGNSTATIKMEKGCQFETKTAKFKIENNGKLSVFNNWTKQWQNQDSIKLTSYQFNTLKAVANNTDEGFKEITLSKNDIFSAINKFKKGELSNDLSEFLSGYKIKNESASLEKSTVSAYITNGNSTQSSKMSFKILEATESSNLISDKNIITQKSKMLELEEDAPINEISSAYGIDPYRLTKANPQIKWKVTFDENNIAHLTPSTIPKGTIIKIPEKYKIQPNSVKSFDDVAKITGVSKSYIKDILMGIEGLNGKPALKAYYDKVGKGKGTLTIGFGHCGKVNGKPLTSSTKITEAQAYELLAQDILDAKTNALDYFGKTDFNNAPKSIQTALIDIAFNKGIYSGFMLPESKTTKLKENLKNKDYVKAAANTVRKTGVLGLRKRNVYRAIMATGNLPKEDRLAALELIKPEYNEVLKKYKGTEKRLLEKAWKNAYAGKTSDFFN